MNRLVIIGNGFDLAHKLPTSYRSFVDFIWKNFHNMEEIPLIKNLFILKHPIKDVRTGFSMRFENYNDFYNRVPQILNDRGNNINFDYVIENTFHNTKTFKITAYHRYGGSDPQTYFDYNNRFFELITVLNAENWVDIENTYYDVLVSLLNGDSKYKYIENVKRLNEEFNEVKNLLEYYLTEHVEKAYQFNLGYSNMIDICDLFEQTHRNLGGNNYDKYFLEFPPDYRRNLIDFDRGLMLQSKDPSSFENLFLDFNYTPTISNYINILNHKDERYWGKSSHIQIHGRLHDIKNQINFGFGDEMDDNYNVLEKVNDNQYLENIKSFMYLSNSNYRKLLQWVDSGDFQVFIMGHSCGLSDRTMLNTVFEHNNCKSIKVFYHEKEDGTDNFKDLTQNISRHFNKKALMRTKVVDKSLSSPLPQNIRFTSNILNDD